MKKDIKHEDLILQREFLTLSIQSVNFQLARQHTSILHALEISRPEKSFLWFYLLKLSSSHSEKSVFQLTL